jgi:hypothetical protein
MTLTDYLLDIGLIAIVVLQVRGRRLTTKSMIIPFVIVGWAASNYLHGIPTGGNDLVLIVGATLVGAGLGALCGVFTSVKPDADGFPIAKAGAAAAILWIVGVGTRFAFQLYASHGGGPAITRFSASHSITSSNAWTAALILMAIGEVALRTVIVGWKAYTLRTQPQPGARAAVTSAPLSRSIIGSGDRSF